MAKNRQLPGARPKLKPHEETVGPNHDGDQKPDRIEAAINRAASEACCMVAALTVLKCEHLKDTASFRAADEYVANEFRKLLPPAPPPDKPPPAGPSQQDAEQAVGEHGDGQG